MPFKEEKRQFWKTKGKMKFVLQGLNAVKEAEKSDFSRRVMTETLVLEAPVVFEL